MENNGPLTKHVRVREPVVEGIFYANNKEELEAAVDRLASEAESQFDILKGAQAAISPHAGYSYSGVYAASAFRACAGRTIETVVILAPVHREPDDAIYLTESSFFSTPMGKIPVDGELVAELEGCSTRIFCNDIPHLEEHGIEVQLPFIQRQFPEARIVPILMGRATITNVGLLAKALDLTFGDKMEKTLFVVSSNLSSHTEGDTAAESMHKLIQLIEKKDCEELLSSFHKKEITACGAGCIAALCRVSQESTRIKLISKTKPHTNIDDSGKIIHYGAIAFYAAEG